MDARENYTSFAVHFSTSPELSLFMLVVPAYSSLHSSPASRFYTKALCGQRLHDAFQIELAGVPASCRRPQLLSYTRYRTSGSLQRY
jgi:hypothetical protein